MGGNDCVYWAWNAYAQYLGCRTSKLDLLRFWYYRYSLCGAWPGQPTPIAAVLDALVLVGQRHRLMLNKIEMEVYGPDDLNPFGSVGYFREHISPIITLGYGLFFSLDSRHTYFGRRIPDDWICMAIQLRRY